MFIAHMRFGRCAGDLHGVADLEVLRRGVGATQDAQRVGLDVPRHEIALLVLRTDKEVHVRVLPRDFLEHPFDLDRGLCVL
jgi:hypothetical protein